MGGAIAGGGATLIVAEKAGLSPAWAGAATGGLALAGSALLPSPQLKDACFAAGLGGMGVAGVQLLASLYARQKQAATAQQRPAAAPLAPKRQADGDDAPQPFITRTELNSALSQLADKNDDRHKQTCDLMTALHSEIKKVMIEMQQPSPKSSTTAAPTAPYLYPLPTSRDAALDDDERNAEVEDYERNAYGDDDERNADLDDERDSDGDEGYERNAYGDEDERDSDGDDERNGDDDERDSDGDDATLM